MNRIFSPQLSFGGGRFEIVRALGEGAAGLVFEAKDKERGAARIALKSLRNLSAEALFGLKQEFRSIAGLAHPNLVRLYELFSDDDGCFFTMELVAGRSFLEAHRVRAARTAPLAAVGAGDSEAPGPPLEVDFERLRHSLIQLTEALGAVHNAGKLHLDIKPSNVLVTDQGRVVLLDFGIARDVRGLRAANTDFIQGTPAYMSPEQVALEPLSPASDWYAVGAMLFEVLTGRPPYEGDVVRQLAAKLDHEAPAPSSLEPAVPPEWDALCAKLLRIDPAERAGGREVLRGLNVAQSGVMRSSDRPSAVPSSSISVRLLGRDAERRGLFASLAAVAPGSPSVALVEGVSGMGKSAFVRSFLDELSGREDLTIFEGRCFERESVPYKGFDSIMDAVSAHLVELGEEVQQRVVPRDAAALARLFPVLDRVPAFAERRLRVGESFDAQQLRKRAFAALRELFARLVEIRPLVVFIDDAQWGDIDSAVLLRDLTAPPDPPAMLLILAYRAEEKETSAPLRALLDPMSGLASRARATNVFIGPLSFPDSCDLALNLLSPDHTPPRSVVEAIARDSRGNPFFIGELVRYAINHPEAARVSGLRLETALRERIDHLDEPSRHLLDVLAVAGCPVRQDVAVRAAGLRGDGALSAMETLRASSFVRSRGTRGEEVIECFHDRIRETAATALDEDTLVNCHERLAVALTATGDADPDQLFVHFQRARQGARAAEHAIIAARRAVEALAFDRAARLLASALELLPADDARTPGLRVELADALTNAGRGAEAAEAYFLAATSSSSRAEAVFFRRRAAEELLFGGHVDRGRAALAEVLDFHGLRFPKTRVRAAILVLALRLWLTIRGLGYRPREIASIPPAELMRLDLLVSIATGLVMVDTLLGAPFAVGNVLAALRVGEPWRICRAIVVETCFLCTAGLPARRRVDTYLSRAQEAAESLGRPDTHALVTATRGTAHYFRGEWRRANELLDKGLEGYDEFVEPMAGARTMTGYNYSARWEMSTFRYFTLVSLGHLGELDRLADRLLVYLREAEERGDLSSMTNYLVGEPNFLWLARDDVEQIDRAVSQAMSRWSRHTFLRQHWLELLARSQRDLYAGDTAEAWPRLCGTWRALERSFLLRIQYFRIRALHLRGRLAVARALFRDDTEAREQRDVAAADALALRRINAPWGLPLADTLDAALAHQRGDDAPAIKFLQSAAVAFSAADMPLWASAARRRLGLLKGGDEGAGLVADADATSRKIGVRRPERMAAMMVPGFRDR